MPDLDFKVDRVEADPFSAAPLLIFKIYINQIDGAAPIHAIALRCQIRLNPASRQYNSDEKARLVELFGQPAQWNQTLRSTLWTHATAIVPRFTKETIADLPVPCTYDLTIAMTKYLDALDDGDVPLSLLFSGTIFYQNEEGFLQAAPLSWEKEADFRLPVRLWHEMMQRHYPQGIWLCLNKNTLHRLRDYKTNMHHMTWEQAIDELLESAEQKVGS